MATEGVVETVELEMEEGGVLNGERGTVESVGGEVVGGGKGAGGGIPKGGEREEEIGRASCRERV